MIKTASLKFLLLATLPFGLAAEVLGELTPEGFRVPQPGAELNFPADHGSHPDFKIEWWYLTGHLKSDDGRRFGYQATFFRRAQKPGADPTSEAFGNNHVHLAHMALTDPAESRFFFEERLTRDGWDAWSREGRMDVRNGDWSLVADHDAGVLHLKGSIESEVNWSLELRPKKPLVRFGEDGTSRKGPAPDARSYYLSFTRMATSGVVTIGDETLTVSGSSWMDHEIASNQLDPSYEGWDWIAIQLKDGWEVKAYILRMADGQPSPYSALIWISPDGLPYYANKEAFTWSKEETWESASTGAVYPLAPIISTKHPLSGETKVFRFRPLMMDQELVMPGSTYWEGAGLILDASGEESGAAYLELVGYAGAIDGLR